MASQEIGSLFVALGLDSAVFAAGVKRVQGLSGRLQKGLENIGAKAEALGQKLSVASAAMAAAGLAAGALVKGTADAAKEVAKQAQIANVSTDVFQKWAAGSKTVGIEQEKLADILKDVNDRVGDFIQTGGGPMADFFEKVAPQVGVTAEQFKNLSGPEALQLYVSSLEKAGLSQQEMTFYLEAMASDATALIPLLRNNGAEMTRLGNAAESTGAVMSSGLIAKSKEFNEKFALMMQRIDGVKNRLAEALLPVVNQLIDAFNEHAIPAMNAIVDKLQGLIQWFGDLPGPIQEAAGIIAAAIGTGGPILLAVGALASAFGGLIAATGPIGLFIGAAALASAAWVAWGDDIKAAVGGAISAISDGFNQMIEDIKSAIQWATDLGTKLAEALGMGRDLQLQRDMGFGVVDGKMNPNAVGMGGDTARGLVDGFGTGLGDAEAEIRDYLDKSVTGVAKDHLGIQSPSRVFMEIGRFITQGLGIGITEGTPGVQSAMAGVTDAITDKGSLTDSLKSFADTAKNIFQQVAFEGRKLGDVLRDLATSWLNRVSGNLLSSAFDQMFGIGANANGTRDWRGGLTRVNERGGEIMNLPRGTQIIPHDISKRMADRSGAAAMQVVVTMDESTGKLGAFVRREAGGVMQSGFEQYSTQALPGLVKRISSDPRKVGG